MGCCMVQEEAGLPCGVVSMGCLDFLKEKDMVPTFPVNRAYGADKLLLYQITLPSCGAIACSMPSKCLREETPEPYHHHHKVT